MRMTFLTALAAATILSAGMLADRADAMPAAAPAALAAPTLVHQAAIVCGGNGCNPVHTKAQKKRKFHTLGYTKPI
jgi:hypothetical protein